MKKLIAVILLLALAVSMVACNNEPDPAKKSEGVMTYAEYNAAAKGAEVVIECYVQATQAWWDNKITVYAADPDGAYFLYEMVCSEADAKKLTPGTKIKVSGVKTEWSGEIELDSGCTFEFVNDGITYVSEAADLTSLLGTDKLIDHLNEKAIFKGLTVKSVSFKGDQGADDIYVTFTKDGADYDFCVEFYLTGADTDVYKTVSALKEGDIVDVEAFVYWYNGANPHITAVTTK